MEARLSHSEIFKQSQLWYLLLSILNAIRQFQRIKCISTEFNIQSIRFNSIGQVKIQCMMTSPSMMYSTRNQRMYWSHKNMVEFYVGETGRIGEVLLELAGIGAGIGGIRGMGYVGQALQVVQQRYSELLFNLINVMLCNSRDRPLPSQIYQVISPYKSQIQQFKPFNFNPQTMAIIQSSLINSNLRNTINSNIYTNNTQTQSHNHSHNHSQTQNQSKTLSKNWEMSNSLGAGYDMKNSLMVGQGQGQGIGGGLGGGLGQESLVNSGVGVGGYRRSYQAGLGNQRDYRDYRTGHHYQSKIYDEDEEESFYENQHEYHMKNLISMRNKQIQTRNQYDITHTNTNPNPRTNNPNSNPNQSTFQKTPQLPKIPKNNNNIYLYDYRNPNLNPNNHNTHNNNNNNNHSQRRNLSLDTQTHHEYSRSKTLASKVGTRNLGNRFDQVQVQNGYKGRGQLATKANNMMVTNNMNMTNSLNHIQSNKVSINPHIHSLSQPHPHPQSYPQSYPQSHTQSQIQKHRTPAFNPTPTHHHHQNQKHQLTYPNQTR